jgi:hypothetical protein
MRPALIWGRAFEEGRGKVRRSLAQATVYLPYVREVREEAQRRVPDRRAGVLYGVPAFSLQASTSVVRKTSETAWEENAALPRLLLVCAWPRRNSTRRQNLRLRKKPGVINGLR